MPSTLTTRAQAEVAEQADAHDSNSCSFGSVGSIPTFGIILPFVGYEKREIFGLAFFGFQNNIFYVDETTTNFWNQSQF